MNLAATWQWLTTSPLTAITLTVGVYWACDKLWRRTGRHPLLTPILTEICRQEPDAWLTSLRERLNSYQQVRSLN